MQLKKPIRVLVVQRRSLSHSNLNSRSIGARFIPLLSSMSELGHIEWKSILEDKITLNELKEFDVLIFNKHVSLAGLTLLNLANQIGLKTIYDLDDWIFQLPDYSVTSLEDDEIENIVTFLRRARYVTVSSSRLKDKIQSFCNPILLKNGIKINDIGFNPLSLDESSPPKILYSNTDGIKLVNFKKSFFEALDTFLKNNNEVVVDFWGDVHPEINQIRRVVHRGFMENSLYKSTIAKEGYRFAITPLGGAEDVDNIDFNSCKTCIKYIDYGALGIPGIYSKSPVYEEAVIHGVTGLVANNDYETWLNSMQELLDNQVLRNNIRKCAYEDVLINHNHSESIGILQEIFRRE
jgi:hypothetical protein